MEPPLSHDTIEKAVSALIDIRRSYAVPYSKRVKVSKTWGETQRKGLVEMVETAEKQCADLAAVGERLGRQLHVQLGAVEELGSLLATEQTTVGELQSANRTLERELGQIRAEKEAVQRELGEEKAENAALQRLLRELRLEIAAFTAISAKSGICEESQTRFDMEISSFSPISVFGTLKTSKIAIEKLQNSQFISAKSLEIDTFSIKMLKFETFRIADLEKKAILSSKRRKIAIEIVASGSIFPVFAGNCRENHDFVDELRLLSVPTGHLSLQKGPYLDLISARKVLKPETFPIAELKASICPVVLPIVTDCSEKEALLELETCILFTIYPEMKADPELFSCSVCDLPPLEPDLAFSGFTICAIPPPRPLEPIISRLIGCFQVIPNTQIKPLSLHHIPVISVDRFNYLQLFLELETSNREEPGEKRRRNRLRPVRKDPGEEYFAMSLQVLKLNSPDCAGLSKASAAELYAQALAEGVPFAQVSDRQWGKWLECKVR